ncbi:MAG: hypothetical protein QNJ46_11635 [Leptolyngbyaceae cyanobacterium MO_188.B28]|nr:hypothetical protein [Leptolyngbyaceae cyanobacterium MO_188.B28]
MTLFSPAIKAFERLQASDGLLITADHWHRTQHYHRQRQNFYYQSLHQAGIVSGLGVSVTTAPQEIEARYRNSRWIQVQPGIAIDAHGNPIVAPEACVFQVQSQCNAGESKTVYIVLNYVDPDELRYPSEQNWVKETFRIVEKTQLDTLDVEICRIHLTPEETALKTAEDVFNPGPNCLDLTHRRSIRDRPEGGVRIAQLTESAAPNLQVSRGLSYLLNAVNIFYPALAGEEETSDIPLDALDEQSLNNRDLLYLSYERLPKLKGAYPSILKTYLKTGGVLLIAVDSKLSRQGELAKIRQDLSAALAEAENDPSLASLTGSVQAEIEAIDAERMQFLQNIQQSIFPLAHQLDISLMDSGDIPFDHPIRTTPFLFSSWPVVEGGPLQLFCWGGLVLMVGNLAQVWGPDEAAARSRESIRTAHEMGINLLYYAWRRRQLVQLQQGGAPIASNAQHDSLTNQVNPLAPNA